MDREAPFITSIEPGNNSHIKSSTNITITVSDSLSGINTLYYDNGNGTNITFYNNTPFNPGWTSEGTKTLTVWIEDNAGNWNSSVYTYVVDETPPYFVSVSPSNNSYVKSSTDITIDVDDVLSNIDTVWFDNGNGTNVTFTDNVAFNPGWTSEGTRTLTVWVNDTAGNVNSTVYTFIVDDTSPFILSFSPANNSNITSSTNFLIDVADALSGVDTSWFDNGNGTNATFEDNVAFNPGFTSEGSNMLHVWVNDSAGNMNYTVYIFTVDNTPPNTTDNATSDWRSMNMTIFLNCTDNITACNVTLYCIYATDEFPCTPGIVGNYVNVGCNNGSTCRKYVRYRSNDTVGNLETTKNTTMIRIDKEGPSIVINNPKSGYNYSGVIELSANISDSGIGQILNNNASYYIINASNLSEIVESGNLSYPYWNSTWNSSNYTNGTFVFKIIAQDTLGNGKTANTTFYVDNQVPTAIIHSPSEIYINSDFTLNLEGIAVDSSRNLTSCEYYIFNSTDIVNWSSQTLNAQACTFTDIVNITEWQDGNYTINFTVRDNLDMNGTSASWFYIDRQNPSAIFISPQNQSWQNGTISISYNVTDDFIYECKWRWKQTVWSSYFTITCGEGSFSFDTSSCSDTNTSDCIIQLYSKDLAGNENATNLYLNIDNSPPSVTIIQPSAGSWHSSNFTVSYNAYDNVGSISCSYRINGSKDSGWINIDCNQDVKLDITYCQTEGSSTCTLFINTTNNVGMRAETNRSFSMDFGYPYFVSVTPTNGSHITSSTTITIDVNDSLSGVSTAWFDNGNGTNVTFTDNVAFNPGFTSEGSNMLHVWVNDSAGNMNYTIYVFVVDDSPPETSNYSFNVTDSFYNDTRLYVGESLLFYVNVSDATNVSSVIATINSSNIEENITLSPSNGNLTNDIWNFTYTPTTVGEYKIKYLYVSDTLGNTERLNETVINSTFTVVNASLSVKLSGQKSINSGFNETLNISFNFNKTVTNPNLVVYVPNSYTNLTSYTCSFGNSCSIVKTGNTLNVTTSGSGHLLYVSSTIKANTPENDTNTTWLTEFNNANYSDITTIKTPLLNITEILCNGNSSCIVYQNIPFNLSVVVANQNQSEHSGDARNVYVNFTSTPASNMSKIGDLSSGHIEVKNWTLNISSAGSYIFTIKVWETYAGAYNTTVNKTVIVKDTEPPELLEVGFDIGSNIFNVNETVSVSVTARDNGNISYVWMTINNSNGVKTNHTLNLTAGSLDYGIWSLNYTETNETGVYNITTIYINDTENNLLTYLPNMSFEVRELSMNISISNINPDFLGNVTIYANISGNATTIQSVAAQINKPRNVNETIYLNPTSQVNNTYLYAGTYTNITRSGNYSINVTAHARQSISRTEGFYVDYGNVSVSYTSDSSELYIPVDSGPVNLTWFIIPLNGDVIDLNAYLLIDNETVINTTAGEVKNKSIGNVSYEEYQNGKIIKFEINETSIGWTNVTLFVNSSSLNVNASSTILINVTQEDPIPPNITGIVNSVNKSNLFEIVDIYVNATDNSVIDNVTVEITYPGGEKENLTAMHISSNTYKLRFSNTNETGNFSYSVFVFDVSGNSNSSVNVGNFTVYDTYNVTVYTPYSIYNKGENVSIPIVVKNVNNQNISGFNITLIVDRAGTNVTVVDNQVVSTGYFFIQSSYPPIDDNPVTYYVYVNVSKNGNTGENQTQFNVSKLLDPEFVTPKTGNYFSPGSDVPVNVRITNERGEIVTNAKVIAYCGECENEYSIIDYNTSTQTYKDDSAFEAPTSDFAIFIYSIDFYKNDQGSPPPGILLTTQSTSTTQQSGGGGTGGTGTTAIGAAACTPEADYEINCSDNIDNDCDGYIDLNDIDCRNIIYDFDFKIPSSIKVVKGENQLVVATFKNKVESTIKIKLFVKNECCNLTFPEEIELPPLSEKQMLIKIHASLKEEIGDHLITFIAKDSSEKTIIMTVKVEENQFVKRLSGMSTILENLKETLLEYEKIGMNIKSVKAKILDAERELKKAYEAIENDDLERLELSVRRIDTIVFIVSIIDIPSMALMKFLYQNMIYIVIGILSFLFGSYFTINLIVPYYKLKKLLIALSKEEKSIVQTRRSAEIQYFKREIDENTFRGIMVKEQDKLLAIRSKKKETEEKIKNLIESAFSLKLMLSFFWKIGKIMKSPKKWIKAVKKMKAPKISLETIKKIKGPTKAERCEEIFQRIEKIEKMIKNVDKENKKEFKKSLEMARESAKSNLFVLANYYIEKCEKMVKKR